VRILGLGGAFLLNQFENDGSGIYPDLAHADAAQCGWVDVGAQRTPVSRPAHRAGGLLPAGQERTRHWGPSVRHAGGPSWRRAHLGRSGRGSRQRRPRIGGSGADPGLAL